MQQLTPRSALGNQAALFVHPAARRLEYQRQGLGLVPIVAGLLVSGAITGVTAALRAIFSRKGPAQREAATAIVNDLEPLLQQNLQAYLSGPRTVSNQQAALANFDSAWQLLTSSQYCGNPALGDPGRACIADRSRGGRWDWASYYRDPIASDPDVRPDPTVAEQVSSTVSGIWQRITGSPAPGSGTLLGIGAAVVLVLLAVSTGNGSSSRRPR